MAEAPIPAPEEPRRGRRRRLTRPPRARVPVLADEQPRPLPTTTPEARKAPAANEAKAPGYYGHPIVKAPVWTWEIPLYFFLGGTAGALSVIAFAGTLAGAPRAFLLLAFWIAAACASVAPVLLIADLKRPKRFLNMLRVFKWRSPMSVGAWILSAFAPAVVVATLVYALTPTLVERAGWPPLFLEVLLWLSLVPAALLGTLLSTYTGVLIGVTAVPAWAARSVLLPIHFGVASLGSAAAILEIFFRLPSLWALGAFAALIEIGVALSLEKKKGRRRDAAVREGRSGRLLRISGLLSGAASLAFRLVGLVLLADLAFIAGALVSRFGWLEVGRASAKDPTAALDEPR